MGARSNVSMVIPLGARPEAARSVAELNDPDRKLPEKPSTFTAPPVGMMISLLFGGEPLHGTIRGQRGRVKQSMLAVVNDAVARCELRDCLLGGVIEDDAANGLPGAARECEYGRGRPRFVRCCDVFHVRALNRLELKNNWYQGDDAGIGRVSNENGIPHDRAGDPTQPTWQSGCRGGREKLFLESLVLEAEEFAGTLRLHGPPQVPQP